MQELHNIEMVHSTIIEHRPERWEVGVVEYSGLNGDGKFGVGWHHHSGNRTTLFDPRSWKCRIAGNVVFLERTAPDDRNNSDIPWPAADIYIIVRAC